MPLTRPVLLRFCLLCFCATGVVVGQEPVITGTSPNAIMPGQTVDVKVMGSQFAGAKSLWTSFDSTATLVADSVKPAEASFKILAPADTTPGIYGIRIASDKGISGLRLFLVDDLPSVASAKARTLEAAQVLKLPIAIDGIVDATSLSLFKFHANAGQRIAFEVLARRIGSALDPLVRILDANGRELMYSDDELGLSGDSRLSYTFPAAGDFFIELRDIRYQGGAKYFYRLRIGDFPCVSVPYPMGTKKGATGKIEFVGSDISETAAIDLTVPADSSVAWMNLAAKRNGGLSSAFAVLAVGAADEFSETEPNNDSKAANRITLGQSINGRLKDNRDVDRYVFAAKKGQTWSFRSVTRRLGSPADLILSLFKADGGRVAQVDDVGTSDSILSYKFPADGEFTLEVRDLHHRGGPQFAYRIETALNEPGFSLSASADRINIPAGGTAAVTVSVVRKNYKGSIDLSLAGSPDGITSWPTVLGPGINSVVLTLQGTAAVVVGSVHPVRIVGIAKIGDQELTSQASITTALKGATNQMPWPPQILEHEVAVGVAPKPPFSLATSQPVIEFARTLKATVKVTVARQPEFDEAITLAVTPAKNGLPGGVTAAVKPIPKGKNEIEITFAANDKAPLGQFTAVLTATHKKGKQTVVQTVPGLMLTVSEPYKLSVEEFKGAIPLTGTTTFNVKIVRNPAFKAAVKLTVAGLPAGVTATAAEIAADANEVQVTLTAKDAKAASVKSVSISGVGQKLIVKATVGPLKVE